MSRSNDLIKQLLKTSKYTAELEAQLKAIFQKVQFLDADTKGAGVTVVNVPSDSTTFISLAAITKELSDNEELNEDDEDRLDKYEVMNLKTMQRDIAATDCKTQVLFQIITNDGRKLRYRRDI